MTVPETLPTLLAELERLGVRVESVTFDPEVVSIETTETYFHRDLSEFVDCGDAVSWAQVIASINGGIAA